MSELQYPPMSDCIAIQRRRQSLRWSLTDFSRKVGWLDTVDISRLEQGKLRVTTSGLAEIKKILGMV